MKRFNDIYVAAAIAACLTGAIAVADEPSLRANALPRLIRPKIPHHAPPAIPAAEPIAATTSITGFASQSALTAKSESVAPQATTLSPPVTLTYSGSSNAITVTDSGTGRGISSSVTNTGSGSSALYGGTVGSGAGLTGFNSGTGGPGGKFQVTNAQSGQAGAFASTNGTGPAILATVTNTNSDYPAIYGLNTTSGTGVGIEGDGSNNGVIGTSSGYGGIGVSGAATGTNGSGVYGQSDSGAGVFAELDDGTPNTLSAAVYAEDESNSNSGSYGVYGYSEANTSAYFTGGSAGSGYCSFSGGTGWNCSSDKNLKKDFVPVDGTALLEHLAALPVFEYSMKGEHTATRYVGPTAQDFMSAFHLGDNDTLINTANAQGVALAAAKGLYEKVKQDEVEIATLKQELAAQTKKMAEMAQMTQEFSARLAMLEQQRGAGVQTAAFRAQQPSTLVSTR